MKQSGSFLFTLLILLGLGPLARAQDDSPASKTHFNLGLKLGVNLSRLEGQSWDAGYKTNALGGAYLAINGARFGIQVEGLFSQTTYVTGTTFNEIYHQYIQSGKDSLQNGRFRLSYFNIPVLAQVRILNRAWLQVGPQFSGNVSVKDLDNFVKDAESLFSNGTVSLVTGLQVDLTRHLNLGGRYVIGFKNIDESGIESWKQRDIQIHLGYRF
jgi:hypothetical protein